MAADIKTTLHNSRATAKLLMVVGTHRRAMAVAILHRVMEGVISNSLRGGLVVVWELVVRLLWEWAEGCSEE